MVFTHSGRLGDFFITLPVYSAWYKKYGQPVKIVVPENFPFAHVAREFVLPFEFIESFETCSFNVWHFDCGGIPYIWNPNDHGVNCENWINLGFRGLPDKYSADFCAEEHGIESDYNFYIDVQFNPELHEKYKNYIGFADASAHRDDHGILEQIMIKSEVLYHKFDLNLPLIENLKIAKHCKYNVCAGSAMAILLNFAKIPFSVYTWQTPPNSYYRPSPDIFGIWTSPYEIIKSEKNDILKFLNIKDINND
jgi:hypothetical protein